MKNPTREEVELWIKEYGYDGEDCDCCRPQRRVFEVYLRALDMQGKINRLAWTVQSPEVYQLQCHLRDIIREFDKEG